MTPNPERKQLLREALEAVEEMQARLEVVEQNKHEPIAVVGMSCRFPGGANTPELFWKFLQDGVDLVGSVPEGRWAAESAREFDVDPARPISEWQGGFLDHIDEFDSRFFGIVPREATTMDPQQRLVLEVSWEALERAGIPADTLRNSLTGVFVGVTTSDYAMLTRRADPSEMDVYVATGGALNVVPGRVAYTLGLQGPCMAVDTACSSSLVAVHLACQSLRNRESNLAIAGGVNALLSPDAFVVFNRWGMMAHDGRCKTFDARADGFVRAEGCGIIVLKRLSDARADGDSILALIRGSAVNQDGRSTGLTAPNGLAQQQVIRTALANAGVGPSDISYIEAHGTGTALGDPIEVEAIGAVLGEGRAPDRSLVLGSVKTNIGHAESAAGIAGLIKTIMALQNRILPPHLHFTQRSPDIPWPDFSIEIPDRPIPWPDNYDRQLAGVSAFGFSGTNAHVILESAPGVPEEENTVERTAHLIALSARDEQALRAHASHLSEYFDTHPETDLADAAYSLNAGRSVFTDRLAIVATTREDAVNKLRKAAHGERASGLTTGAVATSAEKSRVAFLFSGQGSQYPQMGRLLFETQPAFRDELEECDEILRPYLPNGLLKTLYGNASSGSTLDHTSYTQPALVAIEYALAKLWMSWGIQPYAVLGHSIGEIAAACIAGVFSLEDALRLAAERGRLMGSLPSGGAMAAVLTDGDTVADVIRPFGDSVVIAALNGPRNTVISGQEEAVLRITEQFNATGVGIQRLNVSHAFHSPLMDTILPEFQEILESIRFANPKLRVVANVTGEVVGAEIARPEYWMAQARNAVQFNDAIDSLHEMNCGVFLETGPGSALVAMGQSSTNTATWLTSLRKKRDDWETMLASLGRMYTLGVQVSWAGFEQDYDRRKLALPTYPFQRQRHWFDTPRRREYESRQPKTGTHPLLGARIDLPGISEAEVWENTISLDRQTYLIDHQVQTRPIVPATAYMEMAVSGILAGNVDLPISLAQVQNHKPMYLEAGSAVQTQVVLRPTATGATYEVYGRKDSIAQDQHWTKHASGTIRTTSESESDTWLEEFVPEAIIARCNREMAGKEFYRRLADKGNQWGPDFQGVERLWIGDGESLSLVRVPDAIAGDMDTYILHPAVADACGHVLTAMASMDGSDDEQSGAFVAAGIDTLQIHKPYRGSTYWCYARLRTHVNQSDLLIGDVSVYDEHFDLCAETVGVRMWKLDGHLGQAAKLNGSYYEVHWTPLDYIPDLPDNCGTWLIFADSGGVGVELANRIGAAGGQGILVYPGDEFECDRNHVFRLRPGQSEDFVTLLNEVPDLHFEGIAFLWGIDDANSDDLTLDELRNQQMLGSESVLCLAKAILDCKWSVKPRLWLVTAGVQVVEGHETVSVAQAPLWGFGRTIALEQTSIWGGLLDLDPLAGPRLNADNFLRRLFDNGDEDQIAIRGGNHYGARLVRHRPELCRKLDIRSDVAYLITGGLGGLGLEASQWLAEEGAQHLILVGRTPLPPRDRWSALEWQNDVGQRIETVQRLEARGITVTIATVDVEDMFAMRRFLGDYAEQGGPPIGGVIHAAGTMHSAAIQEQTIADMRSVYAPKVAGSWALHTLLRGAQLDFFVLFSSGSALLGPPLMSSYSGANSFMDSLAHYRRSCGLPALSINWGTWRETGMATKADADSQLLDPSASFSNSEALAALSQLLRGSSSQVAAMLVDWSRYADVDRSRFLDELVVAEPSRPGRSVSDGALREMWPALSVEERQPALLEYVHRLVVGILGFRLEDLDTSASLTTHGMDSLMAVELKNRIELETGIAVPMVNFLQGPSVTEIAQYIVERMTESQHSVVQQREEEKIERRDDDTERLLANLDQLSDEQIDALLSDLMAGEEFSHE